VAIQLHGFPVDVAGGFQRATLLGLAALVHQACKLVTHPRARQTLQGLWMVRLDQQRELEAGLRRGGIVGLQTALTRL